MQSIEIFRPGTHTASSGAVLSFGAAEVDGIASAYDPAMHEAPVVVGHPEHDRPAYGWVKGLAVEGGALMAELDQVDPDFRELVKAGRFKKISASFYRPDAAANPKPGSWYLRHVGFLGAQPPSVKGLKPVQFAGAEDGVVEFAGGAGAESSYGAGLPDQIEAGDRDALVAAAHRYQDAQGELGREITIATALEAVRMRDPKYVGHLAVDYIEAHAASPYGVAVTVADACHAIRSDPAGAARKVAELRAAADVQKFGEIEANGELARGYQDHMAALGVTIDTVAAVQAITSAGDQSSFAEAGADPERVARAAQAHQAKLAQLGISMTIAQAVVEVREQLGVGRPKDPLDPVNLLLSAEQVGLTRTQLVREAKQHQAMWARSGVKHTLFEAAYQVIKDRRERLANRPMTAGELAGQPFA